MSKFVILLVCLASSAAAGILDLGRIADRRTGVDDNDLSRIGTDRILRMSRDELMRQKFLLDVLLHAQQPLVQQELVDLGTTLIEDQSRYFEQINDEMLHLIELCRNHRLLGKQEVFTIANEDHLRQMVGLYRILVRSRDWETFQRNACFARIHMNGVLFANALVMAVRDRDDSRSLIVPAIHEILPELFFDEDLVRKARSINLDALVTRTETIRPGLLDMIGLGRRQKMQQQGGGQIGTMDKSQLWMPWREMRLEMAARRTPGEQTKVMIRNEQKLVLPVERRAIGDSRTSLLTEDIGLNGFLLELINDLVLNQRDTEQTRRTGDIGVGRVALERDETKRSERLMGRTDMDEDVRRQGVQGIQETTIDNDRLLRVGRRRFNKDINGNMDMDTGRWMHNERIVDGRRVVDDERWRQMIDMNNRGRTGMGMDQAWARNDLNMDRIRGRSDRDMDQVWGRNLIEQGKMRGRIDDDLPTTTIDDERLLHINRRHMQDSSMDMTGQRRMGAISQRDRFMNIVRGSRISDGRRIAGLDRVWAIDMGRDTDRRTQITRGMGAGEWDRRRWGTQMDTEDDDRRLNGEQRWGQQGTKRGEWMDDDRKWMRGDRNQDIDSDRWMRDRSEGIRGERGFRQDIDSDSINLPTTHIDDERLLHVSRRRLNMNRMDDDNDRIMQRRRPIGEGHKVVYDRDMGMRGGDQWGMGQRRGINEQGWTDDRSRIGQDTGLRTTTIDDARLLHINRRRLDQGSLSQRNSFLDMVHRGIRDGRRILDSEDRSGLRMDMDNEGLWENNRRQWDSKFDNERTNIVDNDAYRRRTMGDDRRRNLGNDDQIMGGRRRMQMDTMRSTEDIGTANWGRNMDNDRMSRTGDRWSGKNIDMMGAGWGQRGMQDRDDIDSINRRRTDMASNDRLLVTGRRRRVDIDGDDMNMRRRVPRSLRTGLTNTNRQMRGGEALLYNLQQVVARINMEQIALGLVDDDLDIGSQSMNNPRLVGATGERLALRLNDMRLDTRRSRMMLERINDIEQRLRTIIDQEMQDMNVRDHNDVDRVIGEVLLGGIQRAGLLDILREVASPSDMGTTTQQGVLRMRDPIVQHLLRRIVRIVDMQRQRLGGYRREDIVLDGVRIKDIRIDELRTYVDLQDTDLINLLDQRLTLQKDQVMQKMLVARQQRLNHKSFNIKIDLTADRNQRVVVRTLLVPKIDATNRELNLNDARLNAMLLDATLVDLTAGQNVIERKSKGIRWTSRDTTTYTEIYQRVMQAMEGRLDMRLDQVVGQNCRLPHRLLLPRGRVSGLPMQILVVVTPALDNGRPMQQTIRDDSMCGIGAGAWNIDRLPMGFPMDRKIDNVDQILNLPNLMLKDVMIYHDENVRMNMI